MRKMTYLHDPLLYSLQYHIYRRRWCVTCWPRMKTSLVVIWRDLFQWHRWCTVSVADASFLRSSSTRAPRPGPCPSRAARHIDASNVLATLDRLASSKQQAHIAVSTRTGYDANQQNLNSFCSTHGLSPFVVSQLTISRSVAYLCANGIFLSIILV